MTDSSSNPTEHQAGEATPPPLTPAGSNPGAGSGSNKPTDPLIGVVVESRYKLIRVLGHGGMGTVYQARDEKFKGRPVALKLMNAHLLGHTELKARFEREAILQANLLHGQIIQILDFGECAQGQYFVMEYSEGRTLQQLIKELAPLQPDRALAIAEQILEVLDFAHRNDVAHRDLKPSNILVEDRGGRDYVRILDFGIAKVLRRDAAAEGATLTQVGSTVGTLGYMPPEQATGDTDRLDHRIDIYAAGIVLYELLTGKVPAPRDVRTDAVKYAIWVSQNPVPPMRVTNPKVALSQSIEDLVLGALHRSPDERYPSALAFTQAIRSVRGGSSPGSSFGRRDQATAGPTSQSTRILNLPKPSRRPMVLAGVFLLALSAMGAFGWWRAMSTANRLEVARDDLENVRVQLAAAGVESADIPKGMLDLTRDAALGKAGTAELESARNAQKTAEGALETEKLAAQKLRAEIEALRGDVERGRQSEQRVAKAEQDRDDARGRLDRMTTTLNEREDEISKLRDQKREAEQARDVAVAAASNRSESEVVTKLREELSQKAIEVEAKASEARTNESLRREAAAQVDAQQKRIDLLNAEILGLQDDLRRARSQPQPNPQPQPIGNPGGAPRRIVFENAGKEDVLILGVTVTDGSGTRPLNKVGDKERISKTQARSFEIPAGATSVTVTYDFIDRYLQSAKGERKTQNIPIGTEPETRAQLR